METGFIYAATGPVYTALARRSAQSLRKAAPSAMIDLWCDGEVDDPVFDRVHRLDRATKRPKFEALRRSRFSRSVYLDADTVVLIDPSDLFAVLDRFDIAAAHVGRRNAAGAREAWRRDLPLAFPQINTGVIGLRKSARTDAWLLSVDQAMEAAGARQDQPIVRELLFESDLRLTILPPEYNFKQLKTLTSFNDQYCAPRILHAPGLHQRYDAAAGRVPEIEDLYRPELLAHLQDLIEADAYLNEVGRRRVRPLDGLPLGRIVKARLRALLRRPSK